MALLSNLTTLLRCLEPLCINKQMQSWNIAGLDDIVGSFFSSSNIRDYIHSYRPEQLYIKYNWLSLQCLLSYIRLSLYAVLWDIIFFWFDSVYFVTSFLKMYVCFFSCFLWLLKAKVKCLVSRNISTVDFLIANRHHIDDCPIPFTM